METPRKQALLEAVKLCEEMAQKYIGINHPYAKGAYDAAITLAARIKALPDHDEDSHV